jgi:xanthine dehydrogenase YagR molybdenum-binding subunit
MLYGRMIGASVPAAEILEVDTSKAEALPGVKAVWVTDSRIVRFAGQDVAAVAATSPDIARDAARLVKVRYKERPFAGELREAMKPDAPGVFFLDRMPVPRDLPKTGNVAGPRVNRNQRGDVDKGFAEAEVVHEGSYYCPVHTHAPLETHGVVASWEGDQLTIYASTQALFAVREGVAEALGVDRKNVRVLCEHMGGGFGSKLGPSATGSAFSVVACRLSKTAGAPVKLMLDRHQEHLCTGNAPSALMTVKVGAKKGRHHHGAPLQVVGLGRRRGRRRHRGTGRRAPRQEPEPQDRRVRRLHERGALGSVARARPLAGRLRARVGDRRARREARPRPARGAAQERGEPGPAVAVRRGREGDRLGAKEQEGRRHGDRELDRGRQGPRAVARPRSRDGERQLVLFASENSNAQVRVHRDGSVELLTGCQDIGTGYRNRDGDRVRPRSSDRPRRRHGAARRHAVPRGPGLRRQHHAQLDGAGGAAGREPGAREGARARRRAARRERSDLEASRGRISVRGNTRRPSPSSRPRRR